MTDDALDDLASVPPEHAVDAPSPEEAAPKALPPLVKWFPLIGAGVLLLLGMWILLLYLAKSPQFLPAISSVGALYVAGKEGGIPLGLAAGGDPVLVALCIYGTDMGMTLLLYPLVHAAFDGVQRKKGLLGSMLRTAQRNANKRRKVVDKYGALGIYIFMLVPFAFNSPLVGIALGRIANLSPLRIMVLVGGAIASTTVMWTLLVDYGLGKVLHVSAWVPVVVSLSVTAGVFVWGYLETKKERRLAIISAMKQG